MFLETEADVESELLQNEKTKEIDINRSIWGVFMQIDVRNNLCCND
jgi:hypothetical protein